MKPKTLLLPVAIFFVTAVAAQKGREVLTGFAITSAEKGGRSWKEVRLVNIETGEVEKSIFSGNAETKALNARTKKPITAPAVGSTISASMPARTEKKVVNLDQELSEAQGSNVKVVRVIHRVKEDATKPFATNSAAMAYDARHERLYYTPMGINQLRYRDIRSGKVYYFENESFGTVTGLHDVKKQITRMVIGSDGNGYAVSNDAQHFLRFTTGKKPTITDLGPLSSISTQSPALGTQYGGDMIADAKGNLYVITASRNVYLIDIKARTSSHLGTIKGLPKGYSTNGAMVEGGSKVIVCSSESTAGYYRFDLNTLDAEKISTAGNVFNASDLANGVLAFDKKDKKKEVNEEKPTEEKSKPQSIAGNEETSGKSLSVYPNPVTDGRVTITFKDQAAGRYQLQVMDLSGKMITNRAINLRSKGQVEELRFPDVAKGSYILRVVSESGELAGTSKLVVQ